MIDSPAERKKKYTTKYENNKKRLLDEQPKKKKKQIHTNKTNRKVTKKNKSKITLKQNTDK